MSEREPITGELREAVEWEPTFCGPDRAMVPQPEFDRLCDAIDAVHDALERENAELRQRVAALDESADSMHETDAWKLGYDEGFASADDWLGQHEDAMAEHGWVRLPVDADGVPLHIGDVMENLREDLEPKLHHRFKVYGIQYRDYGQVCTLTEDGFPSILYRANECRHHAPTVEDVLREMLYKSHIYDKREMELLPDLIAEYAAKLRLAGDAE